MHLCIRFFLRVCGSEATMKKNSTHSSLTSRQGNIPTINGKAYLRLQEAAHALDVSRSTLKRWTRLGKIRAHRPSERFTSYAVADIVDMMSKF